MPLNPLRPLEPAIPEHLQVPHAREPGVDANYVPATASYSARFRPSVRTLPMIFVGVQYREASRRSEAVLEQLAAGLAMPSGPLFWDRAEFVDQLGFVNAVLAAYWDDRSAYDAWQASTPGDWWRAGVPADGDVGCFKECFTPGIEDTETTFSHPHPEGYAKIASGMSGEVREHGYWGSSRDRIPRSQTDSLTATGMPLAREAVQGTLGRHIIVEPHDNLCLLRSGQDWSSTTGAERAFYLDQVEPVLREGMTSLRDDGLSFGCFFNRFMRVVTDDGPLEKTYSLSAWHDLSATEQWARDSRQHLAIFGRGTQHYSQAGQQAMLSLYHEMSVIRARDQSFEYFNCHPRTGMLNAIR